MADGRCRCALACLEDVVHWDVGEEASVWRWELPEVSEEQDVKAAEGANSSLLPLFHGADLADRAAQLHVHGRKQLGAHHADLVDDEPAPLQRTLCHALFGLLEAIPRSVFPKTEMPHEW